MTPARASILESVVSHARRASENAVTFVYLILPGLRDCIANDIERTVTREVERSLWGV